MAKVFISYSRKDIEFAKKLTAELAKSEMDFWVDWEGIPPTVDWWKEIEKGIEESDAFLFLISPDSSASKVCGQEIDCAIKNSKRIIPLVVREAKGSEAPKQLSHLNWIFFRPQDDFNEAIKKLLASIHTDYEWVQAHRRLQVKALEWERSNKDHSFLLRGADLLDAESDLALNTSKQPHPTDLMREYVFASRKATDRQRRITTMLSVAAGITLALLAVYGFVQAGLAKAEARRATAGQLALESKTALDKYPQRALLLALESVRISQDANEPVLTEAEEALRFAVERVSGYGLATFTKEPSIIQFTKDGKWLLAGTQYGGEAAIWNVQKLHEDSLYEPFPISFEVDMDDDDTWNVENGLIKFSANETWLMVNATKSGSGLWKLDVEDENRTPILFDGKIDFLYPDDEMVILEKQTDAVVIWQVNPVEMSRKELHRLPGAFLAISEDARYVMTNAPELGVQVWDISTNTTAMLTTLTEPGFRVRSAAFDAEGRWAILVVNVEHPDLMIENMVVDENTDEWVSVMQPWVSNNLVVYSLDKPEEPVTFELGLELYEVTSNGIFDISPNGGKFLYAGTAPSLIDGPSAQKSGSGVLDLTGSIPVNTVFDIENLDARKFIGNNFVFVTDYSVDNTGSSEKFIDLRDLSQVELTEYFYDFIDLYISPDGKYAASGDLMLDIQKLEDEHEVRIVPIRPALFGLPKKIEPGEFENSVRANPSAFGLEDVVVTTTTSPNGRWLVAGTADGSVRFWNADAPLQDTRMLLPDVQGLNYIVAMSNDDQWMTLGNTLWALEDGKPVRPLEYVFDGTQSFLSVFSPDSHWNVSVFSDFENVEKAQIVITDLEQTHTQGKLVQKAINNGSGYSATLQFSTDSRWLVVLNENSFLYDLEGGKVYELPFTPAQAVFMEGHDSLLLIQNEYMNDGQIISQAEIWALPIGGVEFAQVNSIKPESASQFFASQNGRWLAGLPSSKTSRILQLWDVWCVLGESSCKPKTFNANKVAFSRDSKILLLGLLQEEQLSYEMWDLGGEDPKKVLSDSIKNQEPILGASGRWILFGKQISLVGSFQSSTWSDTILNNITTFDGYGTYFLGGGGGGGGGIGSFQIDYIVQALGPSEGLALDLRGHESNVSLTHISPNEQYVLTYSGALQDDEGASEDVFRLWDLKAMQENPKKRGVILPYVKQGQVMENENYSTYTPLFSQNNEWVYVIETQIVYGIDNGEYQPILSSILHYTPTSIEVLKERACQAVGRNFIINEWERFFPDDSYRKTCENLPEHPSAVVP